MKRPMPKAQSGFTLVEIAIVLVIIGLLLGGVLKGAELIENSRVRQAVNQINGVTASFYAYQDRYNRIPGDDGNAATVQARGSSWAAVGAGNNNGLLQVNNNQAFTGAGEGQEFFQHLKAAGFITGNPADAGAAALPRNPFGGLVGVSSQAMMGALNGNKVCLNRVNGKAAQAIDNQLDDGNGATGQLRASQAAAPANGALATPYNEDQEYTICMRM